MKNYIIAFMLFISITGLMKYFQWYMDNFHQFSDNGAGGLACLGLFLALLAILAVPYVLEDVLD